MGRKSNAKKKNRKVKEQIKQEKVEKKQKKKINLRNYSEKMLIITFLVFFIILLSILTYLVFKRAFRPQEIAKLLPEHDTVALIEINIDSEHQQFEHSLNLLLEHTAYSEEQLIEEVNQYISPLNFVSEIKPWLGRQAAYAIFKDAENNLVKAFFFEYTNLEEAEKFIKKSHVSATIVNKYVVISSQQYDFLAHENTLYNSDKYQKINDNLPIQRLAFLYIDFDNIDNSVLQNFSVLSEQGISMLKLGPLIQSLDAEGIALFALEDKFAIQSFLKIDRELVANTQYLPSRELYKADLLQYLPKDVLTFWGGQNLQHQLKRLFEITADQENLNTPLLDKVLEQYTNKYFGSNVNFEQDILPFLNEEFLVAIEQVEDQINYKLLFQLANNQIQAETIDPIIDSFASTTGAYDTKIVTNTLADGTVGREIIAVPKEIIKTAENYKESIINTFSTDGINGGISYTIIDNVLIISNSRDSIKTSIELAQIPNNSIKTSETFEDDIKALLWNSDEVSYLNLKTILGITLDDYENNLLNVIQSISSGHSYFNDGVLTLNYLELKTQ